MEKKKCKADVRKKKRDDEETQIKAIKKQLKREFKNCSTEEEMGENRQKFFKLIRLHNKLRKCKIQSAKDKEAAKQREQFRKNPSILIVILGMTTLQTFQRPARPLHASLKVVFP